MKLGTLHLALAAIAVGAMALTSCKAKKETASAFAELNTEIAAGQGNKTYTYAELKKMYSNMDAATMKKLCNAGGPGATSCSVEPGVPIAGSITTACAITCDKDHVACCGLLCVCVPAPAK